MTQQQYDREARIIEVALYVLFAIPITLGAIVGFIPWYIAAVFVAYAVWAFLQP